MNYGKEHEMNEHIDDPMSDNEDYLYIATINQPKESQAMNTMNTIPAQTAVAYTPAEPTPAPAPTPEPSHADMLLAAFVSAMMPLIDRVVEAKFKELVDNHSALTTMDDKLEERIREIAREEADDVVSDHVAEADHLSEDSVNDLAVSVIEHSSDLVTRHNVSEIVNDILDEELSGRVESIIDGASISISV